jgi:hypothetical protein
MRRKGFLTYSKRSSQDASAIPANNRLLCLPGHLLALHYLQNLLLQEHAMQADSGKYVLEFDSGGEYIQGGVMDCVDDY